MGLNMGEDYDQEMWVAEKTRDSKGKNHETLVFVNQTKHTVK